MNAKAQFTAALYYEGLKAKLNAASNNDELTACVPLVTSEAFEALPEDAQTELLALYARALMRQGAFAP